MTPVHVLLEALGARRGLGELAACGLRRPWRGVEGVAGAAASSSDYLVVVRSSGSSSGSSNGY